MERGIKKLQKNTHKIEKNNNKIIDKTLKGILKLKRTRLSEISSGKCHSVEILIHKDTNNFAITKQRLLAKINTIHSEYSFVQLNYDPRTNRLMLTVNWDDYMRQALSLETETVLEDNSTPGLESVLPHLGVEDHFDEIKQKNFQTIQNSLRTILSTALNHTTKKYTEDRIRLIENTMSHEVTRQHYNNLAQQIMQQYKGIVEMFHWKFDVIIIRIHWNIYLDLVAKKERKNRQVPLIEPHVNHFNQKSPPGRSHSQRSNSERSHSQRNYSENSRTHPESSRTHPESSRTHPESSRNHPESSRNRSRSYRGHNHTNHSKEHRDPTPQYLYPNHVNLGFNKETTNPHLHQPFMSIPSAYQLASSPDVAPNLSYSRSPDQPESESGSESEIVPEPELAREPELAPEPKLVTEHDERGSKISKQVRRVRKKRQINRKAPEIYKPGGVVSTESGVTPTGIDEDAGYTTPPEDPVVSSKVLLDLEFAPTPPNNKPEHFTDFQTQSVTDQVNSSHGQRQRARA